MVSPQLECGMAMALCMILLSIPTSTQIERAELSTQVKKRTQKAKRRRAKAKVCSPHGASKCSWQTAGDVDALFATSIGLTTTNCHSAGAQSGGQ